MKRIFLTGVTGFIGSHLAARLLKRGDVVAVIERNGNRQRVLEAILTADPENDWDPNLLYVIAGDITKDKLGIAPEELAKLQGKIDQVVHIAGSTRFQSDDSLNVECNAYGARRMAELVRDQQWGPMLHVSTAYVCGWNEGQIREELITKPRPANEYEESKIRGESMVTRILGKNVTILRPSIVVASLTRRVGQPMTWEGYYGYFRGFWKLKYFMTNKNLATPVDLGNHRIPGSPEAEINLIPVDNLVEMAVALMDNPASLGGIFHGTNPVGPKYQWLVPTTLKFMGITGGRIEEDSLDHTMQLEQLDEWIRKGIDAYRPYVSYVRTFDVTNIGLFYDMRRVPRITEEHVAYLIGQAIQANFGHKPKTKVS